MVTIKAKTVTEGVEVYSDIEGRSKDVGLEIIHLIAVIMREIKKLDEGTHALVLEVLANDPSILFGEFAGDEIKEVRRGVN